MEAITPIRICTICGRHLPATPQCFTLKPDGGSGLNSKCKSCERTYRLEHHKHRSNAHHLWANAHKDTRNEQRRARYANDSEYRAKTLGRNKNKYAATYRAYYEAHREDVARWAKAWRAKNRNKIKARDMRRRALLAGAVPNNLTADDISNLYVLHQLGEADLFYCYICRGAYSKAHMTVDHIIPLVLGGANTTSNVNLACRSCNSRKGGRLRDNSDSRTVPYDANTKCDGCGKIGAFDFMGDHYCVECSARLV